MQFLMRLPRWLRRCITVPVVLVLFLVVVGLLPVWLIGAAFIARFVPGRWRPFRFLWFAVVYIAFETIALVALFGLWLASGFGWKLHSERFVDLHHRLMAWFLRRVLGSARFTFRLRFEHHDDGYHIDDLDRPLLVVSRHAGAGDSFLIVDGLMNRQHPRRPRIVLKDTLQLDPTIDVLLNRIGASFVRSGGHSGQRVIDEIARLAETADRRDALLIFPEGGNFTERRRARAIEQLEQIGRDDLVERAEELTNLLPPKPLGVLTAIRSAPDASVVFVGHTGLEDLSSLSDLWHHLPKRDVIRSRSWRVAPTEIPPPDERELWLYDQWEVIDTWIDEQRAPTGAPHTTPRPPHRPGWRRAR